MLNISGDIIYKRFLKDEYIDGLYHKSNENGAEELFGIYQNGICYSTLRKSVDMIGFLEERHFISLYNPFGSELLSISDYNNSFYKHGTCL